MVSISDTGCTSSNTKFDCSVTASGSTVVVTFENKDNTNAVELPAAAITATFFLSHTQSTAMSSNGAYIEHAKIT